MITLIMNDYFADELFISHLSSSVLFSILFPSKSNDYLKLVQKLLPTSRVFLIDLNSCLNALAHRVMFECIGPQSDH